MKPSEPGRDPRLVFLLAIPALVAAGFLVQAAVGPGPSVGFRTNRAIEWFESGRADLAWPENERILAERPDDPGSWLRAGRSLRVLDRPAEAALHFTRGTQLAPDDETLQFERARAFLEAGLPELAEQAATECLAIEPEHAGAHYVHAAVAVGRGDTSAALDALARSLDCGPSWPDRFRSDPAMDPLRNDFRFLPMVIERRVPGLFRVENAPRRL
ncbi:MAG: tetratricopeptide repeat protein [Gemmatimonadetes bacterium]|nr:tetratricopeptide repeat protein [Gemmatimonadota bacterium]